MQAGVVVQDAAANQIIADGTLSLGELPAMDGSEESSELAPAADRSLIAGSHASDGCVALNI